MRLDEFITSVLISINNGLSAAQEQTDRKYSVMSTYTHSESGVHFDIAVTTSSMSGSKAEGAARAGLIQVVDAKLGAEIEDRKEDSQISRIVFSVYVPPRTV